MEALVALGIGFGGIIGFILLISILRSFRVLNEYERGVEIISENNPLVSFVILKFSLC